MENKEKKRMDFRQVLIILVVAMAFYMVFDLSGRISAANRMVSERDEMATRVDSLKQTEAYLQTKVALATQPSFIEPYIRPEGKMLQPGDIPIIPIPGDSIQATQVSEFPTQSSTVSNWEIWWDLFFGK